MLGDTMTAFGRIQPPLTASQRRLAGACDTPAVQHVAVNRQPYVTACVSAAMDLIDFSTNALGGVKSGRITAYKAAGVLSRAVAQHARHPAFRQAGVAGIQHEMLLAWVHVVSRAILGPTDAMGQADAYPVVLEPVRHDWKGTPITRWRISEVAPRSLASDLEEIERFRLERQGGAN